MTITLDIHAKYTETATTLTYPGSLEQAKVAAAYYAERNDVVIVKVDGEVAHRSFSFFYSTYILGAQTL